MTRLFECFPDLTQEQRAAFVTMEALYREWNARINVISRKDMDNFCVHHALHSLAIAKAISFPAGSHILDLGTGGGFPGIPLAVLFPDCRFTLCDSIGKKIRVAEAVAEGIGLKNVEFRNCRAEELKGPYDYVVSRAVTDLSSFYPWVRGKFRKAVFYLKGGNLEEEIVRCCRDCRLSPDNFLQLDISDFFADEFFKEKKIVIISQ